MLIEPFRTGDIPGFLELAAAEGWLVDPWEFSFLLTAFPSGCFIARVAESPAINGFVTALRHERSGWIGNLIVRPDYRGKGIGEALFLRALNALRAVGTETVWLTASDSGKALYEKQGFKSIDTINRWSGSTGQSLTGQIADCGCTVTSSSVSVLDYQSWGDRRDGLLAAVAGRGDLLIMESGFLVVQPCGESMQIGPFSARDSSGAEHLLDSAFQMVPQGTNMFLDSPVRNNGALQLLSAKGLHITGSNELMIAGIMPDYRPELMYGLATPGSCG